MTPSDLEAIRARLRAASTRSPWSWEPHGSGWAMYAGRSADAHGSNILSAPMAGVFDHNGEHNRAFIAHAPQDIEALLAALAERDAEIARLRGSLIGIASGKFATSFTRDDLIEEARLCLSK